MRRRAARSTGDAFVSSEEQSHIVTCEPPDEPPPAVTAAAESISTPGWRQTTAADVPVSKARGLWIHPNIRDAGDVTEESSLFTVHSAFTQIGK